MVVRIQSYFLPSTLNEALQILNEWGKKVTILAGGTDLLPRIKEKVIAPVCWMDIRLLPIDLVKCENQNIIFGARVTHTQAICNELIKNYLPVVIEACREIAAPPIRNRGTIGGNLINASPAADTAPALLVSDAYLVLESVGSKRNVPISDFFCNPGETVRRPDELLTQICAPIQAPRTAIKFYKLGQRNAMAVSLVSIAAKITLDEDERVIDARIAFGSVAPVPMRAVKAEALLEGKVFEQDLIYEVALVASKEVSPITDIRASAEYRKHMVEIFTGRILTQLSKELKESYKLRTKKIILDDHHLYKP
jgi:CO/xanthine dehydrogenase FAD-binding subunit